MMWVGPKHIEAMPPILPKGECTVRVQPSYLRNYPQNVRNRTVEMLNMNCFRQNEGEIRCVPASVTRTRHSRDEVVIIGRQFFDTTADEESEPNCRSFEGTLISKECQFTIQFEVQSSEAYGSTRIIGTEFISAVPK
jgi:hypothetical protein